MCLILTRLCLSQWVLSVTPVPLGPEGVQPLTDLDGQLRDLAR
ncbi:MAG: hypothetical protein EWM72_02994 [Nitrospira sp.]|nr:MAG: hypothetical protein EWM72_02994 [Nitrospira sp.]